MDCKRSKNRLFGEEVYYNGCVSGWLKLKISTTLARGVVVESQFFAKKNADINFKRNSKHHKLKHIFFLLLNADTNLCGVLASDQQCCAGVK